MFAVVCMQTIVGERGCVLIPGARGVCVCVITILILLCVCYEVVLM